MTQQFDPNKEHNSCGTPECCMHCDTADYGQDWYLVGINPWYKTLFNVKTKERVKLPYKDNAK